jgi:SET domain-containing protein
LGRLINHSHKDLNLKSQIRSIDETPHLFFTALRNISAGEELVYDYGDCRKEAIAQNPWLAN